MWYLSQYTTYRPITGVQMVEQNHGSTLTYFAPDFDGGRPLGPVVLSFERGVR